MSAICESLSCSEAQLPLDQLIRMTLAKDADGCLGLRMISDGTGGGGGSTTLFYNISETAAKTAVSNATLVPGALYGITLDGTSQGNADDIIYVTAIDIGAFATGMTYLYAYTLSILDIQGSFTASGFTLLKADEAARIVIPVTTGSVIDVSTVNMFGIFDIENYSASPIDTITGMIEGINYRLQSTDGSLVLDVAASFTFYPNGYVGNWAFDVVDFLVFHLNGTSKYVTQAYASSGYTGGPRRYVALLNQTGTSAPVATVLENTLGGVPVWSYVDVGTYAITLNGAFISGKTVFEKNIKIGERDEQNYLSTYYDSSDTLLLYHNDGAGTDFNNPISNQRYFIEVYP